VAAKAIGYCEFYKNMPNYNKAKLLESLSSKIDENIRIEEFMRKENIRIKSVFDKIQENIHYLNTTLNSIVSSTDTSETINVSISEHNKISN
jgi:hypothetical protein